MACDFLVTCGSVPQTELDAYLNRAIGLYGREPQRISVKVDGDYVDLDYEFLDQPFERIRRITGYLVGTLDRFNNGKRCEERDRVKHTLLNN